MESDTTTSGGAEAQIVYVAKELASRGHDVSLIFGEGLTDAEWRTIDGVKCIDAGPSWRRPDSLLRLWSTLSELSPEVVFATLPSDFLVLLGVHARRHGAKFVYWLAHDSHCSPWGSYPYKRWFHEPLYALGLECAHVIGFQHVGQAAAVSSHLQNRLAPIPNLLRSTNGAIRSFADAKYEAMWVALIRPVKQLEIYLDLAESMPHLRFAIVGGFDPITIKPHMRAALESRIARLDNVHYLGPKRADEVLSLLSRAKMLVNTSESEGFPITMLEAWSVGAPVVTLSVDPGGVIEREQMGRMCGDLSTMRETVSTLARSEDENRRIGGKGFAYVNRAHSREAVCSALISSLSGPMPQAPLQRVTEV